MILYQGGKTSTLHECYQEARLLIEALEGTGLAYPHELRDRAGSVTFNRHPNGDIESIFVTTKRDG